MGSEMCIRDSPRGEEAAHLQAGRRALSLRGFLQGTQVPFGGIPRGEGRGYSFDVTAVAHVLLELVREEVLDREGSPRRYLYVERRRGSVIELAKQFPEGITLTAEERTAQPGTGAPSG